MGGTVLKTVLLLCCPFLLLVCGCGTGPAAEEPPAGADDSRPAAGRPADTGVFFPKLKEEAATPLEIARGELLLDDAGCLRVADAKARGGPLPVPLWTPMYELRNDDGGVRVLDGRGRVVARLGEQVAMGGGSIDGKTLEERGYLDKGTVRELFERCPGDRYYMVLNNDVWMPAQG